MTFNFSSDNEKSYEEILQDFSQKWLLLELTHRISKSGSNDFWSLSKEYFPSLIAARMNQGVTSKFPQFPTLRKKLYDDYLPPIKLEVVYEHKQTGDVIVLRDLDSAPVNRFKPSEFTKLYETVTVKVKNITGKKNNPFPMLAFTRTYLF